MVQVGSKKNKIEIIFSKLLSYFIGSQIWLNLSVGQCQFGYITKFMGKKILGRATLAAVQVTGN